MEEAIDVAVAAVVVNVIIDASVDATDDGKSELLDVCGDVVAVTIFVDGTVAEMVVAFTLASTCC